MSDDVAKFQVDGRTYAFDMSALSLKEAEQCEQLTGWTWMEWLRALLEDEARPPRAIAFLLWLALIREGEEPRFSDLDFNVFSFQWIEDDVADGDAEGGVPADDAARPTGADEASSTSGDNLPATA